MPAVTAVDWTALPQVTSERADGTAPIDRPVITLTTAPSGFEGEGFPVRRAFAGVPLERLDPFVHMDQMGEVNYAPGEAKGTPWHPHRGFETVTYMIDGIFEHQDSTGGGGVISDGATQWMTAGAGILHIERPPEHLVLSGGIFHGVQLWVNLPAAEKWVPPRYQSLEGDQVILLGAGAGSALVRVIAGDLAGRRGPGRTYTPISVAHATITPGGQLTLPWPTNFNALVYGLAGRGFVGSERRPLSMGQLAVLGSGDQLTVRGADRQDSRSPYLEVLLLGGRPIGEPVAHYGPFVMNTRAELAQAFDDFQRGRLGTIPVQDLQREQ